MPRQPKEFGESERDRADYIIKTWRGDKYPPEHYNEGYYGDDGYSKHRRSSKRHHRQKFDGGYEDYSRGQEFPRREFSEEAHRTGDDPSDDYETYAYEYQTQTYSKSPRSSGDIRRREHRRKEKLVERPSERSYPEVAVKTKYESEYQKDEYHLLNILGSLAAGSALPAESELWRFWYIMVHVNYYRYTDRNAI